MNQVSLMVPPGGNHTYNTYASMGQGSASHQTHDGYISMFTNIQKQIIAGHGGTHL